MEKVDYTFFQVLQAFYVIMSHDPCMISFSVYAEHPSNQLTSSAPAGVLGWQFYKRFSAMSGMIYKTKKF